MWGYTVGMGTILDGRHRLPQKASSYLFLKRVPISFPNAESCVRLVRALCVETHENWLEAHRYLNMDSLRELKKVTLRKAA
jgi:transposase-like protein